MKTIIIFTTKYGSTEHAAQILKNKMGEGAEVINLMKEPAPSLEKYDIVILAGSIYVGKVQKKLTEYMEQNLEALLQKRVGLFLCAAQQESEVRAKELTDSFPAELYHHAISKQIIGYEIHFKKMNLFEKMVVRSVMKIKSDQAALSEEQITEFAKTLLAG